MQEDVVLLCCVSGESVQILLVDDRRRDDFDGRFWPSRRQARVAIDSTLWVMIMLLDTRRE